MILIITHHGRSASSDNVAILKIRDEKEVSVVYTGKLARLLSISVMQVRGSILGPVKSDTAAPIACYRCDVSSELCCPPLILRE